MANTLYDNARRLFLIGSFNWETDTIKAILVDTGTYTANFTTHTTLADISNSAIISTASLTGKTATGGAADANDVTFTSVSGASIEAIILYRETNSSTPSQNALIAYIDTATGLPITPNGGDIIVTWDNGTNKIFRL